MPRWSWAVLFGGLLLLPSCAFASRAALDGRGLPRFLALDPSNLVSFPGSAARFGPQLLFDYGNFALGIVGRNVCFGYALDAGSHNVLLSHRSGWGVSIGISDKYDEREVDERHEDPDEFSSTLDQSSRRDLKINLGWSHVSGSNRCYEIALGGSLINAQESASGILFEGGATDSFSYEWRSGPGTQIALRLRTVTPKNGLLLALDGAYEDLHPEGTTDPPAQYIRRYAATQVGWRTGVDMIEDLVIGARLQWNYDSIIGLPSSSSLSLYVLGEDTHTYSGSLFASAQHHLTGTLVARAGVQGNAHFTKETNSRWTDSFLEGLRKSYFSSSESQGSIDRTSFFLGAGWQWNAFTLDGRFSENLSLNYLLTQWSIGYTW